MAYDNAMVAHLWAQQEKDSARSHNGNFSFSGERLYSYSTVIGRFVTLPRNGRVILVTSRRYSVTTCGKHMPALWRAIGWDRENVFQVPCPDARLQGGGEHKRNLEHLVSVYIDTREKARRARDYWGCEDDLRDRLDKLAAKARGYARLFKLRRPRLDPAADAANVFADRAAREARRNTPAAIAKREKDRERREAIAVRKAELARASMTEKVEAWRNGEAMCIYARDDNGGALLRIRGDTLETSMGASVPLEHAIRVFDRVRQLRDESAAADAPPIWARNGESIRVGHFQIDAIYPDGHFRAGCHTIYWPEIERAAIAAGVA